MLASLREAARVLEPGGRFLAAVHGGAGEEHTDDFLGTALDVTVRLTTPAAFATLVERAGLRVDQLTARAPYETEFKTTRIYLEGRAAA